MMQLSKQEMVIFNLQQQLTGLCISVNVYQLWGMHGMCHIANRKNQPQVWFPLCAKSKRHTTEPHLPHRLQQRCFSCSGIISGSLLFSGESMNRVWPRPITDLSKKNNLKAMDQIFVSSTEISDERTNSRLLSYLTLIECSFGLYC